MAYMQWTGALDTGISVIDEQHKRIIFYINELEQVSQTGNTKDIQRVMDGLIDYTVTHFQFEEELQERANYPFLKAHKKVHDIFKKRITGFVERAKNGENVVPELLSMLKVWLTSHIKGDDRDYVDSVKMFVGSTNQENAGWLASTLKRLFGAQAPASGGRLY
jgi:hemerythrin